MQLTDAHREAFSRVVVHVLQTDDPADSLSLRNDESRGNDSYYEMVGSQLPMAKICALMTLFSGNHLHLASGALLVRFDSQQESLRHVL